MTRGQRKRLAAFVAVAKLSPPPQMGQAHPDDRPAPSATTSSQPQVDEAGEDLPAVSNASHFS
jgi:hypothetical protein